MNIYEQLQDARAFDETDNPIVAKCLRILRQASRSALQNVQALPSRKAKKELINGRWIVVTGK